MISQDHLNERAIEATGFLAKVLPRHLVGMRLDERDGHCEIRLGNPFDSDRSICISTERCELTVSFGECHTHYDNCSGAEDEASIVGEMVVKVVLIASGREASFSAWAGNRCLGGGWLPAGADGHKELAYFPEADRLQVVAWEPWSDREILRSEPTE